MLYSSLLYKVLLHFWYKGGILDFLEFIFNLYDWLLEK